MSGVALRTIGCHNEAPVVAELGDKFPAADLFLVNDNSLVCSFTPIRQTNVLSRLYKVLAEVISVA